MEELSPEVSAGSRPGVLSLDEALQYMPGVEMSGRGAVLAANGNVLDTEKVGRFRVYDAERLLGIYSAEGGKARPLAMFPAEM